MSIKNDGRAYSALSRYYEYLTDDDYYEKWAKFVCETVKTYSPSLSGADIACGSGYFTRALSKSGFSVVGYDISPEMLSEAVRISAENGQKIEYIKGDIKNFKSFKKLGFVTAINDGFNYVKPEELLKAFKSVSRNLSKGGVFFFDVSSEYKIKNVLGNNLFSVDEDDFTLVWFNKLFSGGVEMDITIFSKRGELYERKDEKHVQYIHTAEDVTKKLEEAGFKVAGVCGALGEKLSETSERLCFTAVKV